MVNDVAYRNFISITFQMVNETNVKQINLHHCKGATSLICNNLQHMHTKNQNQNLIALVQEPWIKNNIIQGIDEKQFNLFYTKQAGTPPRACIITTKNVCAIQLPQLCTSDICTIKATITANNASEELLLCSIYMPYDQNDHVPALDARRIIEYSENSGIPIIISADSNAHHTVWGSNDINRRGERLLEYLASTHLDILNAGNKPTFVTENRSEVLDITLASQSFTSRVKNWHVSYEETLSDHKEINFSIECEPTPSKLFRNPRNTNWEIFERNLTSKLRNDSKLKELNTTERLDNAVDFLTKSMQSAFLSSCPGRISKPKSNFWWNKELDKLKVETRRLNRIHESKRGTSEEHNAWVVLNKCKHAYTKEIRAAKKGTWMNFCNQIEGVSATARLHKLIAKDPSKGPGILQRIDNSYT